MYALHNVQLSHHSKPGLNAARDNIYKPEAKQKTDVGSAIKMVEQFIRYIYVIIQFFAIHVIE